MANLVELSNQLEYVPQEQLVQMSQDPNSMFPSFLVLSEIQRRNQMKKMYEAQQPKPQTTVAEEVVQEFAGQQGLQGAMAQSPGPQNAFQPGDMGNMAPPSPMQGMAAGGRTGYQTGGSLGLGGDSLSKTFTNPMENQINESSGLNLFGEDGLIFDPNNPLDYLVFVPGVGLVSKGLSSLYKGSKLLSKTAKSKVGQQAVKTDPKKRFGTPDEKGLRPLRKNEEIGGEVISDVMRPITSRPYTSAAVGLYGTSKIADAVSGDEQIIDVEPNVIENPATVRTPQESAKEIVSEDIETGKKGLGNFLPNADPSMLIGLGGAIMSAKNVGELGKGISDMYLGERARKDALQMADLKGRLTEAQIRKYEADVSNMDANQIIAEMNAINKGVESGAITIDDELQAYVSSLRARLQALREKTGTGFAASETPTGGDILARNRVA